MPSAENFDNQWLPPNVAPENAFSNELSQLWKPPSTNENSSNQADPPRSEATPVKSDPYMKFNDDTHHPAPDKEPEKFNKDGWLDITMDTAIGTAAILGGYAIGLYLFHKPSDGGKMFGVLPKAFELPLARMIGVGGTFQAAVPARHYLHEAITGESETWKESADHAAVGTVNAFFSQKIARSLTNRFL